MYKSIKIEFLKLGYIFREDYLMQINLIQDVKINKAILVYIAILSPSAILF